VVHPNGTLRVDLRRQARVFRAASAAASPAGGTATRPREQMLSYDRGTISGRIVMDVFSRRTRIPPLRLAGAVFRRPLHLLSDSNRRARALRFARQPARASPRPPRGPRPTCTRSMAPSPGRIVGAPLTVATCNFFRTAFTNTGNGSCSVTTCKGRSDSIVVGVRYAKSSTTDPALYRVASTGGTVLRSLGRLSSNTAHRNATPITRFDTAPRSRTPLPGPSRRTEVVADRRIRRRRLRRSFVTFCRATTSRATSSCATNEGGLRVVIVWTGFQRRGRRSSDDPFHGGVFDGATCTGADRHGRRAVRYDTTASSAAVLVGAFDVKGWDARAEGFGGGVFDGRYVYLVPGSAT